jgi:hypothetical protein
MKTFGNIFSAFAFAVVAVVSLGSGKAFAAPIYDLKFYKVDDVMSAYITNESHENEFMFSRSFGPDYSYVDISSYITDGLNTILLTLENGPAGYTYGYDFRIEGQSYASDDCGIWNTFGCDNDRYETGIVWTEEISFFVGDQVQDVEAPSQLGFFIIALLTLLWFFRANRIRVC